MPVTSATSTTAYCWLSPIIPALLTVTCSQSRCMCIYTIVYLFPLNLQTSLATNQHDVFSEDAIQSPPDSVLLPTYLSWPSRLRQSQRHHLLTCTQAQPTRSKRLCTSSRGIFLEALLAGRYDEQIRGLRPRRHKMSGQSATNQDSKVSPAHMSKDQMEAATKAPSSEPPKFADKYDFFPVPTCKCYASDPALRSSCG
jgi:hypothetical protein